MVDCRCLCGRRASSAFGSEDHVGKILTITAKSVQVLFSAKGKIDLDLEEVVASANRVGSWTRGGKSLGLCLIGGWGFATRITIATTNVRSVQSWLDTGRNSDMRI